MGMLGVQVAKGWLDTLNENDGEMLQFLERNKVESLNTVKEINKKERTQGEQNMPVEKDKYNDNLMVKMTVMMNGVKKHSVHQELWTLCCRSQT